MFTLRLILSLEIMPQHKVRRQLSSTFSSNRPIVQIIALYLIGLYYLPIVIGTFVINKRALLLSVS